jgi:hypothetical protein
MPLRLIRHRLEFAISIHGQAILAGGQRVRRKFMAPLSG